MMDRLLRGLAPLRMPFRAQTPDKVSAKGAPAPLVALHMLGEPGFALGSEALLREGFAANPVVYRCVRMVSEAASSLPFLLRQGEAEIAAHPLLELLAKPFEGPDPAAVGQHQVQQHHVNPAATQALDALAESLRPLDIEAAALRTAQAVARQDDVILIVLDHQDPHVGRGGGVFHGDRA